jgi:hypothetical protein
MNHTNPPQIEIKSFDLIGEALTCYWVVGDALMPPGQNTDDNIKQMLAARIAAKMIELKLVEFTSTRNVDGTTTFKARAFVLPDGQVKTLRLE